MRRWLPTATASSTWTRAGSPPGRRPRENGTAAEAEPAGDDALQAAERLHDAGEPRGRRRADAGRVGRPGSQPQDADDRAPALRRLLHPPLLPGRPAGGRAARRDVAAHA